MAIDLVTDSDWASIDGDVCRVLKFTPWAKIENGKIVSRMPHLPYAIVTLERPGQAEEFVGRITHKLDFMHLWALFMDRGISESEEVGIAWIKSHLHGSAKLFRAFMPGMAVMLFKAGAYDLLTKPGLRPDLKGEARFRQEMPLLQLIPDVLK
jgi:hypothetical protein